MDEPLSLGATTPLVPPLYQSSVYTIPDLDALDRIMNAEEPGFTYARDAHPNARMLGDKLAKLEGAKWGVITGSGMGSLSAILLATVQQGQRVLASNRLYGRTTQLLGQEFLRYGVTTDFVDANELDAVEAALGKGPRLLLVETASNPLLRVVDVPALAKLCRQFGCLFVVDNTFATPVLTRPLEMGADIVMESLTKMIGGHSDVTLGLLCGNDPDRLPGVSAAVSIWGLASNPFDCWLTDRGMATLPVRVKAASANAAILADWLSEQPGVRQVIYPGRSDHPDHALAGRIMQGGYGNMLCFELEGGRSAVNRLLHRAAGIPFSPSLGHVFTTVSHPGTTSHRYVSPAEKRRQGIGDGLIRMSVGVEEVEMTQRELEKGLV
ncbi:MAG: PLP-dependent transferase [Planctomycetes bacterium]|nr:PLP-dependent transferase [Planctomycetota bacterium]